MSVSLPGSTVTNLHRHRLQWRSLRIIVDSLALLGRGLEESGDARCAKAYYKKGQTLAAQWPLASLASPCGLQSATSERFRAHLTRLLFRSAKAVRGSGALVDPNGDPSGHSGDSSDPTDGDEEGDEGDGEDGGGGHDEDRGGAQAMKMRRPEDEGEDEEEDDDGGGGGAVVGEGPSDEDMRHVRGQETMLRCHVWSCLHQVEVCGALRLHDSNDSGTSQVPQVPISPLFY